MKKRGKENENKEMQNLHNLKKFSQELRIFATLEKKIFAGATKFSQSLASYFIPNFNRP